jgi:glucose-1-phosphate cytidylyltransferase
MKVVILCGGKGTRLREETEYRPKPMVPIGDRPILWHIMKIYACHGFNEFVLCLGYKGELIKDYFLKYRHMAGDFTLHLRNHAEIVHHDPGFDENWTVTLANTGADTMTGGRVKRIEKYIPDDTFMLTYGDGVGNVDIQALLAFHRSHGRIATLTGVRPAGRFGELVTDRGRVTEFNEKPQTSGGQINGGFFVFSRRVFDFLSGDSREILEQEPLRQLAARGELMCFSHEGFWQPMDTYREFELLNDLWARGQAPWKIW